MVDEQAFIATIRARPYEWGPRLVYADWLEEQGHAPRAELLRLLNSLYTAPPAKLDARHALIQQTCRLSAYGAFHSEPFFLNSVGVLLRRVEAGEFWMGGQNGVPGIRQVEIPRDFYLGVFPITQDDWRAVMGNDPSGFSRARNGRNGVKRVPDADLARFPVESVSWNDVQEFLMKLNKIDKDETGEWTYRLPTEAEWEYACRGGATSRKDCSFTFYFETPTNDLTSTHANINARKPAGQASTWRYLRRPTRVGSYIPNPLGLFDMHGNVWEWTDTVAGPARILRGGGWYNYGKHCSAANHFAYGPEFRCNILGFRLARVPVEMSNR